MAKSAKSRRFLFIFLNHATLICNYYAYTSQPVFNILESKEKHENIMKWFHNYLYNTTTLSKILIFRKIVWIIDFLMVFNKLFCSKQTNHKNKQISKLLL